GAIPELRAGCSRVTHPFAARVPRRAFPLDLHVLSTPPAFVLSQDQTLQQNLKLDNQSQQTPKTGPPNNPLTGVKPIWHWQFTSTLLSSQRTNTHRNPNPHQGDP